MERFYRNDNYPFVIELLEADLLPPGDAGNLENAISALLETMTRSHHETSDYDFQIATILLKKYSSLILSVFLNFNFLSLLEKLAVKNASQAYPLVSEAVEKGVFCNHRGVDYLISIARSMDKKEDVKSLFGLLRTKCPERLKPSALNPGRILDYGAIDICSSHSMPAYYLEEVFATDPKLLTAIDQARRDAGDISEEECRRIIDDAAKGY